MRLLDAPSLAGSDGIAQLHQLQGDMREALRAGNYTRVRQLDDTCTVMLDKLIELHREQPGTLLQTMLDLKQMYADLLTECSARPAQVC
ncbi:hypothetical protein [Gilvimarinus agarilyticus]|uniref:hypothetical protein n=1 Tax=Gilvimarinus agarilyticus TaxID=679259 RepID=UPI0005A133E9|nr:hypothetical protein [Gilvimarinus agarilyticus]